MPTWNVEATLLVRVPIAFAIDAADEAGATNAALDFLRESFKLLHYPDRMELRWTTTLDPAIVPALRAMVTTVTAADAAIATDDT
jgi:hypothetical protein